MADLSVLTSRAIKAALFEALEQNDGADWVPKIAGPVLPSDQGIETYGGMGAVAGMRKREGGRLLRQPGAFEMTLKNESFEDSLYVTLDEIRRDKTGHVMLRIRELAQRARDHWAELVSDLIIAGESSVCYDNQYYFDTDHSSGVSGTQSNDLTYDVTTTTDPTPGEMEKAILSSIKGIMGFKDSAGKPVNNNARSFIVMVPVAFMDVTAAALGSQIIVDSAATGGRSNTIISLASMAGFTIQPVVNPFLSSWTTKFATFRADAANTPLIRQEEERLRISEQGFGSVAEFERYRHEYGVDCTRAAGYFNWANAALTTFV